MRRWRVDFWAGAGAGAGAGELGGWGERVVGWRWVREGVKDWVGSQ